MSAAGVGQGSPLSAERAVAKLIFGADVSERIDVGIAFGAEIDDPRLRGKLLFLDEPLPAAEIAIDNGDAHPLAAIAARVQRVQAGLRPGPSA